MVSTQSFYNNYTGKRIYHGEVRRYCHKCRNIFKAALIQIAGRVGRKIEEPNGLVLFLHEGVSLSMMSAKKDITKMNRLGYKRGWLDA